MTDPAFSAGFLAGFTASREGFNGECPYAHLAPWEGEAVFNGLWSGSSYERGEADKELERLEQEAYKVWLREMAK